MRVGLIAPMFVDDPNITIGFAQEAERQGLDGVFVFDHLWPMGQTEGSSLSAVPTVTALAMTTHEITVGTLVSRVGVVPEDLQVDQLTSIAELAPGRFIAGLGVGDKWSRPENDAYAIEPDPFALRVESMQRVATRLGAQNVRVWLGGRSRSVVRAAEHLAVPLNVWQVEAGEWPETGTSVTWGGRVNANADDIVATLESFARAEWVVLLVSDSATDPTAAVDVASEAVRRFRRAEP